MNENWPLIFKYSYKTENKSSPWPNSRLGAIPVNYTMYLSLLKYLPQYVMYLAVYISTFS